MREINAIIGTATILLFICKKLPSKTIDYNNLESIAQGQGAVRGFILKIYYNCLTCQNRGWYTKVTQSFYSIFFALVLFEYGKYYFPLYPFITQGLKYVVVRTLFFASVPCNEPAQTS